MKSEETKEPVFMEMPRKGGQEIWGWGDTELGKNPGMGVTFSIDVVVRLKRGEGE